DGLTPATDYVLRVVLRYDAPDGSGEKEICIREQPFRTQTVLFLVEPTVSQTDFGFRLQPHEDAEAANVTAVALYQGDRKLRDLSPSAVRVENLLSHASYRLLVTYRLDGEEYELVYDFTTKSKQTPSYTLDVSNVTQTGVAYQVNETDTDQVGRLVAVELLEAGGSSLHTLQTANGSFSSLQSASQYVLRATYRYDLNDGMGEQEGIVEKRFITPAKEVTVTDIEVMDGKTTLNIGESVRLSFSVTNPDNVVLRAIVVNGVSVSVNYFGANLYVGEYEPSNGGEVKLKAEGVEYTLFGSAWTQPIQYTDSESLTVLGQVTLVSIALPGGKTEFALGITIQATVTFSGSKGYDVQSIRLNYSDYPLTKVSDTVYTVTLPSTSHSNWTDSYHVLEPQSVSLSVGGESVTQTITGASVTYCIPLGDRVTWIDISTPEQLQSMVRGEPHRWNCYRLVNHIDMTGLDWTPVAIDCMTLDGNGFEIRNLHYTETVTNSNLYGAGKGLFYVSDYGRVQNLTLKNCSYRVFHTGDSVDFIGFFGDETSTEMLNCHLIDCQLIYAHSEHLVPREIHIFGPSPSVACTFSGEVWINGEKQTDIPI
ncbi:MAG: hypothetical protein IJX13_04605, partial [Clostridia bacterium]|nr:hypothetical protein [Clostridia bacterium]